MLFNAVCFPIQLYGGTFSFSRTLHIVIQCTLSLYFCYLLLRPDRGTTKYCNQPVCVSVCPRAYLWNPWTDLHEFVYRSPVALAWPSSGCVAIRYVLPVLWMTSCLAIMGRMAIAACDTGAASDVYECLVFHFPTRSSEAWWLFAAPGTSSNSVGFNTDRVSNKLGAHTYDNFYAFTTVSCWKRCVFRLSVFTSRTLVNMILSKLCGAFQCIFKYLRFLTL